MPITDLWGGQLKKITFGPVDHDLVLRIEITDGDSAKHYCLVCREISELSPCMSISQTARRSMSTELGSTDSSISQGSRSSGYFRMVG